MTTVPEITPDQEERFWRKVDRQQACWRWTGSTARGGYGIVYLGRQRAHAHRVAYRIAIGPVSGEAVVDHRCFNHDCVNPDHLRLVTAKQNSEHRRGAQRNSVTGIRGVMFRKGKYEARVRHKGCSHYGGRFASASEAEVAVKALRARLFTHDDE